MQIETKMRYHYTSLRIARIQNTDNTICKGMDQKELLFMTGRDAKWYSDFGRQFDGFLQK